MRWGCCTTVDNVGLLENVGYDYIELSMVSLADDGQYERIEKAVEQSQLAVEVFNVFLPRHIKVVGPEIDQDEIRNYVGKVIPRAAALGGKVIVFGSGQSRWVPDGFSKDRARQQIIDFTKFLAEEVSRYGMEIGVEPLRSAECNLLNYVSEVYELVEKIGIDIVGVAADFYHITEGSEPLENVVAASTRLKHIHLADSGRKWPGSGSYDYTAFFRRVKQANYDQRMSIECIWDDFSKNIKDALAFLKSTWDSVTV